MEQKKLSVDVINEFIHFCYQIDKNYQNEHCSVHNFSNDVSNLIDDKQDDTKKIAAFKKFCQDNIK